MSSSSTTLLWIHNKNVSMHHWPSKERKKKKRNVINKHHFGITTHRKITLYKFHNLFYCPNTGLMRRPMWVVWFRYQSLFDNMQLHSTDGHMHWRTHQTSSRTSFRLHNHCSQSGYNNLSIREEMLSHRLVSIGKNAKAISMRTSYE